MVADLPPVSPSRSMEAPFGFAGSEACGTYKLQAPAASALAALVSPAAYASFCRASSSAVLPHLFMAGTNAADQHSNQLHVVGYVEETCEVECSCRLVHPPEVHALALLPSLGGSELTSLSPDHEETGATEAREASNADNGEGDAAREERPRETLSFFTAFPDQNTRYAADRCVLWRSSVDFPSPAVSLLDAEEEEESLPSSRSAASLHRPSIVSELKSSQSRFQPIRKLVVPRGDPDDVLGSATAGGREPQLLVMMEGSCELFKATESSFESCALLPADPHHRYTAVTFDHHHPHTIVAAEAREDALGGMNVFGSGGSLRIFDLREKTNARRCGAESPAGKRDAHAVNPHGRLAAPLSIDFNPNLSFSFVSGASDGCVAYWDGRTLQRPLQVLRDVHSHWVTSVSFNAFHDQLLLTASTDNTVKLHHAETLSVRRSPLSSSLLRGGEKRRELDAFSAESESGAEAGAGGGDSPENAKKGWRDSSSEIVYSYEGGEDSVVAVAWAAHEAWACAALTAEGCISFHQVPPKEKYRILL
ncbi:UNVERIFIED_CONTAM: WD domain, G-beta repeat-containing protein [Hammondia hammondi]|eukprot:XP_008885175.1 WD domain, G-beta repeat-containing protein [Hammondia hammondi]